MSEICKGHLKTNIHYEPGVPKGQVQWKLASVLWRELKGKRSRALCFTKGGGVEDSVVDRNRRTWEACTPVWGHADVWTCCCQGPCLGVWYYCSRGLWWCLWPPFTTEGNEDVCGYVHFNLKLYWCTDMALPLIGYHTVVPTVTGEWMGELAWLSRGRLTSSAATPPDSDSGLWADPLQHLSHLWASGTKETGPADL